VNVSAPRAIENFLDMGHFPYVHTDILGAEPHTEVKEYDVEISYERDEILATRCRFFQPRAALTATEGQDVDYIYRVPHPYCSVLYKSCPADESRLDVIAIFCQPMTEETIRAHLMLSLVDDTNTDAGIRRFQQTIFGQDRPILENQYPKRLPLDPRAETPIRADKSAIAYRRWLSQKGVNYGVIPQQLS
jgi:phenylpropionate dioxygenase-like ring-hydroxylating dioxygenase large terminal subunit